MKTNEFRNAKRLAFAMLLWLTVLCVLLLSSATQAWAVTYYVFGQVFQVTEEDAGDELILDSSLIGDGRPFAKIKLFDNDTGEFLGEATSDHDGIFTVQYNQVSGSTPNIRFRVYQEVADPETDEELLPAREGINNFNTVGQFFGTGLRVVTDEIVEYGDDGLTNELGVGIVFTRVGKVEIPFISQSLSATLVGLADFTNDTAVTGKYRYQELHVRPFKDAPFAKGLLIFGEFGLPSGGTCVAGDEIGYYRVNIHKYNESTSSWEAAERWLEPMTKMQTQVTTVPTVSVVHTRVPVGPFTGTELGSDVEGLYWVNRNVTGGAVNTFYSFPDLRVNWRSQNWDDGLYKITMEYYKELPGGTLNAPIIARLDDSGLSSCFTGVPSTGAAGLHELLVKINNQPMTVKFDHIYLKDNSSGGGYLPKTGSMDVSNSKDALDFNAEGLCNVMELKNKYDVEVHFTAHHPGSFMRYYKLTANPNACSTVSFDKEVYPDASMSSFTFPSGTIQPYWEGTLAGGTSATATKDLFAKCGYIFTLGASSRRQNGYQHVEWRHPQRAYYVTREQGIDPPA